MYWLIIACAALLISLIFKRLLKMTVAEPQEPTQKPFAVPDPSTLKPPRYDPISTADLANFNGTDPGLPIYVGIKGLVYDVTSKREMYGKGGSYNVFAGKDASKALGLGSLDPENVIADFSSLNAEELKVLDDWESFFRKRYNIVHKIAE